MQIIIANSIAGVGMPIAANTLKNTQSVLDAVEYGIQQVELDPTIHSVGRGGWPNVLGQAELDAAIMNGDTMETGAVGALQGYLHPISVARQVMEKLPHVLLVGYGAARFAAEQNMEAGENLTPESLEGWQKWLQSQNREPSAESLETEPLTDLAWRTTDPLTAKGTTIYLARNEAGSIASGVSTSGWAWKYPGRLGDSPLIGAGSYADSRYGAAACIGHGELAIRAGTARAVVLYLKMGMSLQAACKEAIEDLHHLKTSFRGSICLHTMDHNGNYCVVADGPEAHTYYWLWTDSMAAPEKRDALYPEELEA